MSIKDEIANESFIFAQDTEVAGGVTYGWHPLRGDDQYIQRKLASIFSYAIRENFGWE